MTSRAHPELLFLAAAVLGGCGMAGNLMAKAGGRGPSLPPVPGEALEKRPDDGLTNPTHEKYVGQIVFASQQIDMKAPDESSFVSEFYADELIYGRAYLPHSLENEPVFVEGHAKPS